MTGNRVVVLGGGLGGLAVAARLAGRRNVTLVYESNPVYYADIPKLFLEDLDESSAVLPLDHLEKMGVKLVRASVTKIDAANRVIGLSGGGRPIEYDELIVALGAKVEAKPHLWSLEGLKLFRKEFSKSAGRRVVVCVEGTPYRCPPAPFDVAYRLSYHLEKLGRKPESVTVIHPEKQPLAGIGLQVHEALMESMSRVGVNVIGGFQLREVDWDNRVLYSESGDKVEFDLLHLVPKHTPPQPLPNSDLAAPNGWGRVNTDLRSTRYDDVYMVGDVVAPTLGLPMAGFLALYGADSVASRLLGLQPRLTPEASCPVEAAAHSLIPLCDFRPKLEGKPLPECTAPRVDQRFMRFFRDLTRTKFLSEIGLA
ncbi:MAG: FAD/NAD(P)-binding oxidoreductase [Thermoprotei archaeon]